MKTLQYVSDIHLEKRYSIPKIKPISKNLALLGDIGHPHKPLYKDFMSYVSDRWEKVYYVAGNHEFDEYKKFSVKGIKDEINKVIGNHKNITFLDNNVSTLFDYKIIGTTLWSKRSIKISEDIYINQLFDKSVQFIENELKNSDKVIMLTHHLPTYKLISKENLLVGRYPNDRWASHLDHFIKKPVNVWLCGHSHDSVSTHINDVYIGINTNTLKKIFVNL